ncbi:MAG TPA: 50S ribosomal protein L9, partial [Candidatus Hydrogenedentes bacterium]|nr:50S ribosomal protein L9 [Candidatus Hydrogenedentota bacterium]
IIRKREERRRAELTALARQIEGLTLEFEMRAGEHDKLFGSVTSAMIAEKLAEAGFEVSKKAVVLEEPIKALGIYSVTIHLAGGIEAGVKVWVKGLEGEITTETEPESVEDIEEDSDEDEE